MGVDIGATTFWSGQFVNDRGLEGYDPVKVTPARLLEELQPAAVTAVDAEGWPRLMRGSGYGEPRPIAPNVLALRNKNSDPLASMVSNFNLNLPTSDSAEIVTTPVRYHLDTNLLRAFEYYPTKIL
jgi:hypothetical protein